MAKNKTVETKASVAGYLKSVKDETKRKDCSDLIALINKVSGLEAKMWGTAIVGFGSYHYTYESGREGDAPLVGFSARVNAIVLYLSGNFDKRVELLSKFGEHKATKGCIYIKKLADVDHGILAKMIKLSIEQKKKLYPEAK